MKFEKHVDYDYMRKYVRGNGAGFTYNSENGLMRCLFICTKSRAYVMYVNCVLFMRFIKRKIFTF